MCISEIYQISFGNKKFVIEANYVTNVSTQLECVHSRFSYFFLRMKIEN